MHISYSPPILLVVLLRPWKKNKHSHKPLHQIVSGEEFEGVLDEMNQIQLRHIFLDVWIWDNVWICK